MDKRIEKTKQILYQSFKELLKEKKYSEIVIQDILDKSTIARSTFYAHFKTKDDVLNSVLNDIFNHCFSTSLKEEKTHDFTGSSVFNYEKTITHILYHFSEEKDLIQAIIQNDCKDAFFEKLRDKIKPITEKIVIEKLLTYKEVPYKLTLEATNEMFIVIIKHWFSYDCQKSPEEIAKYYFDLIYPPKNYLVR